jgi:hypothetical protein
MPDFRRGADAIAEAQERAKASGGNFKPFTPSLFWSVDDERYMLFLNPMSDIPFIDQFINFVPAGELKGGKTTYEQVIARTDPVIGEDRDPMVEDWEAEPKEQNIAFAVELEPTFEEGKGGRKRPVGFEVATTEYTRRVRDDKGELTDDTEDVVQPVIGFITQSPHNFFNIVRSYDARESPIEETAVKITRVDSKTYQINGYPGQEIDLSNLIDYIDGVSWLGDDLDDLIEQIDAVFEDDEVEDQEFAAASVIGAFFLDKRLAELVDEERYNELYEGIDKPFRKFGGDKKDKKSGNKKDRPKRERPARRSQRRTADPEPEADAAEPEAAPEPKEEPKPRRSRSRAAKPKDEPKAEADAPEEPKAKASKPSSRQSAGKSKLDELRARAEKRKATAAA